jgi:hypothetical protein
MKVGRTKRSEVPALLIRPAGTALRLVRPHMLQGTFDESADSIGMAAVAA